MRYCLVFGKNWKLSLAEAIAFLEVREPSWNFVDLCVDALVIDCKSEPRELMHGLGGILKIVSVEKQFEFNDLLKQVFSDEEHEERLSFYGHRDIGRQLKKLFPQLAPHREYSATELVKHGGRENALVFGLKACYFGPTVAVADHNSFRKRDESRPLHPPLGISPSRARILVNLSRARDSILDPFCGYGTVMQEACLAGVKQVYGSDIDKHAVPSAHKNLEWAKKTFRFDSNFSLKRCDARRLEECWHDVEAIATEPDLGPALLEQTSRADAEKIARVLQRLYDQFLDSARKVVKPRGRVAMVFPAFNSKKGKVLIPKHFPGWRAEYLFPRVPARYQEYFNLRVPFIIDEKREPGKKRVVAREFCVLERI